MEDVSEQTRRRALSAGTTHNPIGNFGRENVEVRRTWNALGANGLLAKAGEHVPLLADGLVCLHKYRGQTEAEERARAFSLQKHLSKTGALTKLAELLPGSNLIAAAMLHFRGHHREAQEALNLLKNWRDCGSADGALAKVAEMLPGVDVIAFGVHVNAGNFAQALRSISKTRWTDVTGDVILAFDVTTFQELSVTDIQASNFGVIPVASFMYGGLLDIIMNLIEVNSRGQKRSKGFSLGHASPGSRNPVHRAKENLVASCNDMLSGLLQDTLPEMIPDTLDSALSASNSFLQKGIGWSLFLPKVLPSSPQLQQEFQQSLAKVTVRHKRVIPVSAVSQKQVPGFGCGEGVAGGAFCLGVGLHSLGLACLAGCAVTCLQFGRWLQRQFVPFVNDYNAQAWEDATKEPTQVFARQHVQAKADNGRRMPFCVVAEVQDQCAQRLVVALGEHVCNEMPIVKLVGQRGFRRIWRWALGLVTASIDGLPAVPLVLPVEVAEGLYSICGETLWLPSLSFAIIFECLFEREPAVSSCQVIITDDLVDQVLDVVQTGLRAIDLRTWDPRLSGFAEPVNLHCEASLSWPQPSTPRLDVQGIKLHLEFPG